MDKKNITYYHIEPNTYWNRELGIHLNNTSNSIKYYAYIRNSVKFLAYNLFFTKQCYDEDQKTYNRAFAVIPVFESEQEHNEFMGYIILRHTRMTLQLLLRHKI